MSLEAIGIKRFKRFGVWTVQFDWIALECFTNTKNILIYRTFGRNRPMKRINGSDETHDRESLPLSRGRWITNGGSRWSHVVVRYKTHRNTCRWITMERIRCVFCNLISTIITLRDQRSRLRCIQCTPSRKWRSTVRNPRDRMILMLPRHCPHWSFNCKAIGRSKSRHVTCALIKIRKINF